LCISSTKVEPGRIFANREAETLLDNVELLLELVEDFNDEEFSFA